MSKQDLTVKHNLFNDMAFRFKVAIFIGKRLFENLRSPLSKFGHQNQLLNEQVIAFSESDLWNAFDNNNNWILTAGKVENLRIASRKLNGIIVKANETFSFWKHIGNPNFGKGYVIGRELREGCIVPTIAGGLCQLSNALYDAALKANFDIVERHKHTKVVRGSFAEQGKDATVKWNYIDLRFKSSVDFRIEIEFTSDKLYVFFKSQQRNIKNIETESKYLRSDKLNDCYSCGNFNCYKHVDKPIGKQQASVTTYLLDEKWPEFDEYIKSISSTSDYFIVPLKKNRLIKVHRYSWLTCNQSKTKATTIEAFLRALKLRCANKKKNIFELNLQLDKKIARAMLKYIPVESTHVVISQNLLPFVFESGALGGRTFDVLMTRLPIERLHQQLDRAHSKYPESSTLKDFRASQQLVELENKALTVARNIITSHSEIAEIFKNKVVKLDWKIPEGVPIQLNGNKILFPASAVGRKGAYEIRHLAKELNLGLLISGTVMEKNDFWVGLNIEKFNGDFNQVALVVYPTYVEHQPRLILMAISKGIPVITTKACGIMPSKNVKIVEIENLEQMKSEILQHIKYI